MNEPVRIGDATLYLGDCREILPQLGKVDAVVTDPPYGVNFSYLSHDDSPETYADLIAPVWDWALVNARVVVSAVSIKNISVFPPPKWMLAWNKPGSTRRNALGGFNIWEPILVWGKARFVDDAIVLPDCANHSSDTGNHPCPKPLRLYEWLIGRATKPDETVLDPFMGSGTTGVACAKLGRRFIGIEIEPRYFDIACRRIEAAYAQPRLFEEPRPRVQQEAMPL